MSCVVGAAKGPPRARDSNLWAPVVSMTKGERYKSAGDPVSFLDFGAKTTLPTSLNPHSYQGIGERPHTSGPGVGAGSYDLNGVTHMYR